MTAQPTLFEVAKALKRRVLVEPIPETSRKAYESINLADEQERVRRLIADAGSRGFTADEIEEWRGRGGHQRFAELRKKGLIKRNGEKRKTRSGRLAFVYIAND